MRSAVTGTPAPHRHVATRDKSSKERKSDAEIRADVRAWEVQCLVEEMQVFGLRPPVGLQCALGLFISGRATTEQVQQYLNERLSDPVSSLEVSRG